MTLKRFFSWRDKIDKTAESETKNLNFARFLAKNGAIFVREIDFRRLKSSTSGFNVSCSLKRNVVTQEIIKSNKDTF